MREVSINQLPIETIVTPVDKSDPAFDLQTDIIFGGKGGPNINKFLNCIKSIVIGRNENQYFERLYSSTTFTASPILEDSRSIAQRLIIAAIKTLR